MAVPCCIPSSIWCFRLWLNRYLVYLMVSCHLYIMFNIFCMLICLCISSLVRCLFRLFGTLLKWVVCFSLLLNCKCSLYILDNSLLSDSSLANSFSQSVACHYGISVCHRADALILLGFWLRLHWACRPICVDNRLLRRNCQASGQPSISRSSEGWSPASSRRKAEFYINRCRLLFRPPSGLSHSVTVVPFPVCLGTAVNTPLNRHTHTLWPIAADTCGGFPGCTLYGLKRCQPKENAGSVPAQIKWTN